MTHPTARTPTSTARLAPLCAAFFVSIAAILAFVTAAAPPAHALAPRITLSLQAVVPNSGDCNHNGVPDAQETNWANRDDDGDGVCNGFDNCPYEVNADQNPAACQMQAITVPFVATDPTIPHPTYPGANITLKGIARYGGTQYKWDFGDGSPGTAWRMISNAYDLGVAHVYVGAVGTGFTATLSVANGALGSPTSVVTATYPVRMEDASDLTDPVQTNVRAQMAIDAALWYVHLTATRGVFGAAPSGYSQPYAVWNNATYASAETCMAVDSFELHGSRPGNDWRVDPYVEDVRRGLTYALSTTQVVGLATKADGNPDVNGNGYGLAIGASNNMILGNYVSATCMVALADSDAPNAYASAGPTGVYGREYKEIVQDAVEQLAYSQSVYDGGFSWYPGEPDGLAENYWLAWAIAALDSSERNFGSTVPAFVRPELANFWLQTMQYTGTDTYNGGFAILPPITASVIAPEDTAGGIAGLLWAGVDSSDPRVQMAEGYLYRHWMDYYLNAWDTNLGNAQDMYAATRAVAMLHQRQIQDYDYINRIQLTGNFDWFYTPQNQYQKGYATYLIAAQWPDGHWQDSTGSNEPPIETSGMTAVDAAILMQAETPTADLSPASLDFGSVPVNTTSSAQTIVLTNHGPVGLHVWSITASEPFAVAGNNCAALLAANGTACNIGVTYSAVSYGSASGTLSIVDDLGTQTVALSGSTPAPPPTVTVPSNMTLEATSASGASATFSASALDFASNSLSVTCMPTSGSTFPLGANTVICTSAADSNGNTGQASFTVTVQDTTAPSVTAPASLTIPATEAAGTRGSAWPALAVYLAGGSAIDIADRSPVRLGANADNSTLFVLNATTPVTFSYRDASGNLGTASSNVSVILGTPRFSGLIVGQGHNTDESFYVDLRLSNTGNGNARNTSISQLLLRTLSGTGMVTPISTVPVFIGSLDAGAYSVVRLVLNVPATVTRFAITESGSAYDVVGTHYSYSVAQAVTP